MHRLVAARVAEGRGFEPRVGLHRRRFSRPLLSTTQPPLRGGVQDTGFPGGAAIVGRSRSGTSTLDFEVTNSLRQQHT